MPKTFTFAILFLFSSYSQAFDGGEHALIGNLAFEQFVNFHSNNIENLETNIDFSYGEVVAMAGDMYSSIEELALNDPVVMNSFHMRNRNSLKNCIGKEVKAIKNSEVYSGCSDFFFTKKKLKYVTLAHDNYSHFAWHNLKKYVEYHTKALWFAQLAYLKCSEAEHQIAPEDCAQKQTLLKKEIAGSPYREKLASKYRKLPKLFPRRDLSQRYLHKISKKQMLDLALFTNAFADHYLTDSFSAGHLRVPRSQIDRFVENYGKTQILKKNKRIKGSRISGSLTQLLHNSDGDISGTKVTNSIGDTFLLRSDKQLFSITNGTQLSADFKSNNPLKFPVKAVIYSLNEVFDVVKNGNKAMPKDIYAALTLVPFVNNNQHDSLANVMQQTIAHKGTTKKILEQMTSEMSLLFKAELLVLDVSYKDYLEDFIEAIPELMSEFRVQIEKESDNPMLKKRMPSALLNHLKTIH